MKREARHRSWKWLIITVVIVAPIVAGTLTAYLLLRPHSKAVAQVNGVTITQQDLDQQLAFPLVQTPAIFDTNGGAASKKDIEQRNLKAAIDQQLLLQEAKKRGIKVASQVVNTTYSSLTKSYGTDTELKDKLKQANMTEKQLKTAILDNLTITELTKSLVLDTSATETKLNAYYNSHKDRYAGAGSFDDLKSEITADYLNDARSEAVSRLVSRLEKNADIKK